MHENNHELAGCEVQISMAHTQGETPEPLAFVLEDWWDRVNGGSWMFAQGNPAAMKYGMRAGVIGLPIDDEVVYGKVGAFGELVHASEIIGASEQP